jgi:hypothetical protein
VTYILIFLEENPHQGQGSGYDQSFTCVVEIRIIASCSILKYLYVEIEWVKIANPSVRMPGLRYPGPPTNGGYSFFHDVQSPSGTDGTTWDPVDIGSVHFEAAPCVPNKHKPCRPTWMKSKPGSATDALMSMSAPVQGNGGNDSDDLAAMVHDFIESGSPGLLDATDPDTKPPTPLQLRDTLEVHKP